MRDLQRKFKRAVAGVCAAAAFAVAGLAGEAQALTFGNGDLVFALYGNNTEFLQTLGPAGTLLAPGASTNFNVDPSTLTAVGGANPLKWAVVSFFFNDDFSNVTFKGGFQKSLPNWTAQELSQVSVPFSWNAMFNWSTQSPSVNPATAHTIAKTDPTSFTSVFGTAGALAGGFPVSAEGSQPGLLHILQGDFNTNLLSAMGQATLSENGQLLTISNAPVPLPAAVVLFGTGLIGLVGVARRSLSRRA